MRDPRSAAEHRVNARADAVKHQLKNGFEFTDRLNFSGWRHQFAATGIATEYGFDSIVADDSLRYRSRRRTIGHQS